MGTQCFLESVTATFNHSQRHARMIFGLCCHDNISQVLADLHRLKHSKDFELKLPWQFKIVCMTLQICHVTFNDLMGIASCQLLRSSIIAIFETVIPRYWLSVIGNRFFAVAATESGTLFEEPCYICSIFTSDCFVSPIVIYWLTAC